MAKCKATINKSQDGQYYFTVKCANGEITSHGETYTRKFGAERGFYDNADAILKILADRGELIEALTRAGVIDQVVKSV